MSVDCRRVGRILRSAGRRELLLLGLFMALALVVRLVFVWATKNHTLVGDELEYQAGGLFALDGHWFWSRAPYGIAHASMVKPPGYPVWVGLWYSAIGPHVDTLLAIQCLFGPVNVALGWVLGRRLFGPRVALATAGVLAVYPAVWQFETRLYPECLAVPLTLIVLIAFLDREPTPRLAAGVGALVGLSLLVRPTAFYLLGGIAVAWWVAVGWRRGTVMLAVSVLTAALVVAPWSARNQRVADGFVPVSLSDSAAYGTFNSDAANDPEFPYAWRSLPSEDADIFDPRHPLPDRVWRSRAQHRAIEYIRAHPEAVPQAFFWNGLSRLWDIRRPSHALLEDRFEGRVKGVTLAALIGHWIALAFALYALWRLRRRRAIVLPVLALALSASVVFTTAATTRYRATLDPLIVVLACYGALDLLDRVRARRGSPAKPVPIGASAI